MSYSFFHYDNTSFHCMVRLIGTMGLQTRHQYSVQVKEYKLTISKARFRRSSISILKMHSCLKKKLLEVEEILLQLRLHRSTAIIQRLLEIIGVAVALQYLSEPETSISRRYSTNHRKAYFQQVIYNGNSTEQSEICLNSNALLQNRTTAKRK